jgi:probable selenium-dependent hydroxylase accessory protein YqeC
VKTNPEPIPAFEESTPLMESFGLGAREMISLVGAGGKTTLMFRLAKELASKGKKVITTTTTKIMEPSQEESPSLFVDSEDEKIKAFVGRHLAQSHHITIATERLGSKKLRGVSPELITALWHAGQMDYLIVEADGAAGRPVKAPREGEPVIPQETTLVVALLGVDGMDLELGEEHVFRPEQVSRLTGLPPGSSVTDEAMAVLLTHPEGIFKGAPLSSRVVVCLNKVDVLNGIEKGKRVARKILDRRHRQIERIILGQLRRDPPVAEVLFQHHPSERF